MNSVNQVTLIGNMAEAATIRQAGDVEVASFSIATEHSWFNKNKPKEDGTTGDWESKTTWHRITVWRPGKSLKEATKGSRVFIQGRYESNSWQDQNGETRYSMEVIAEKHWIIPKGGNAFQTEAQKEEKKEERQGYDPLFDDAGFPTEEPDSHETI